MKTIRLTAPAVQTARAGHRPHISGAGRHKATKAKRRRTRKAAADAAIKDQIQ